MAGEEAYLGFRDNAGAVADGVQLTRTTNDQPDRSSAGDPMRPLAGRPGGHDLPDTAADGVATGGASTPQLPGLEMY